MLDIKGISPSYCTHKILIEDDYKSVIQPQRRLNPKVQDVVKNEVVKLLDSGPIYLILNSAWVSHIHVVLKKGGMTVVLNDNNELIPSRTVTGWRVILPNFDRTRRSRKDDIHLSLWDFCLPMNAVWIMQRTGYFSKMHDGNFPRHGGRLYGSIHGRLLGIRREVFDFSDDCKMAFNILKEKLTTAPIIISPDWNVLFELMCDTSDFAVGVVLEQRIDEKFKPIYYTSKTLNNAQEHYTTTEKELLPVGLTLRLRIKGAENLAADHLSRLENPDLGTFTEEEIANKFPDEHLMILKTKLNEDEPWSGNISSRSEMPQNNIQFLRRLFVRFRVPKALISDRGTHFCNSQLEKALQKYGVTHKLSMAYHSQTNGQTKVTNRAIKRILERSVGYNPKNWSEKLDDALWAFRTAYETPTGCTPFRSVYGKACHLPVEIEHKAYWALKQCNMDLTAATKNCFIELNELMELRDGAYENTRIYKERTKRWHDFRLHEDKNFKVGDKDLAEKKLTILVKYLQSRNLEVLES
ncbi:reverse transcriptase domain-containing protein [Tanacetum coccineum]